MKSRKVQQVDALVNNNTIRMGMMLQFTKMHGLGNDFMVIDATRESLHLTPEKIRAWSDRHFGIGFDQLLILQKSENAAADFQYRIFNADGGEVAQCGNGARCVTKFIADKKLSAKNPVRLHTRNQILICTLEADGQVTVDMGKLLQPLKTLHFPEFNLDAEFVDIGNPHAVIVVPSTEIAPVEKIGSALTKHKVFPQGANIGFMEILSPQEIRLRVYERGAGETLACGSGACAAAIVAQSRHQAAKSMRVHLRGGEVSIQWEGGNHPIIMTGPAVTVYEGVIA